VIVKEHCSESVTRQTIITVSRRSAGTTPPSQTKGEAKSSLIEGDAADIALDREIRSQKRRLPSNLPVLNLVSHPQATNHRLTEQLMHAEEKMKIAHQEDVHRHEEMVMSSVARMDEMVQEDQGSTIRIEQLERQRDLLSNAVGHVNQVYQKALDDHQRGIQKIEEASYAQHQRDEELAASLHQELVQLRSDAAQAFTNVEQQAQDQGQQLAMEYQKLVDELNQKAHDTLQFKMEASQNLSTIAVMKEQMGLLKNEENAIRDEASKRMSYLESGVQELRNTLDREEFAKSETMLRLRQVEMLNGNDGGVSPSALHSEVGELRRRLKQQEEFQARSQQAWRHEIEMVRRQQHVTVLGMQTLDNQNERTRSAALSFKIFLRRKENDENGAEKEREIVNDGEGWSPNNKHAWMNFVLNYDMPETMKTGYVVIVGIGGPKPSIIDRNTNKVEVTMKVKRKKRLHLQSRQPISVQMDLAVVDLVAVAVVIPRRPPSDAPTGGGGSDVTEVKISRREADKIVVPPFPRVTHLDSWKSHCIANVLGACADPNHEEWIAWISPAFKTDPDIEGMKDSGHLKYKSIDIKLGIAMTAMLKAAGDAAMDLYLDVNRKANKYIRENNILIKGRQIIAMMYESFRTRDRLDMDMVVTLEYLIKLQYQGDQSMSVFKQTWLECVDRMRPEDVPPDNALRDTLHSKIKESPALKMELLVYYDMLQYDDPKRTYQTLLSDCNR
ncbi:unnamed protein product, partial [Symbiodinium microadriaticum]